MYISTFVHFYIQCLLLVMLLVNLFLILKSKFLEIQIKLSKKLEKERKKEKKQERGVLNVIFSLVLKLLLQLKNNKIEMIKIEERKINEKIKEVKTKEKEIVYIAMEVLVGKKIGKEKAEEIMKKIIEEGSDYMLAAEEMIIKENEMIRNEGISIGEARGRKVGENNIIKVLFKNKMTPKEISE